MIVINKKSYSYQQVFNSFTSQIQKNMSHQTSPLQQQLNRLIIATQFIPVQRNFILGYIIKDFMRTTPQKIKDLIRVIQLMQDIRNCQMITNQNFFELIVVLSHVCHNLQKHKISNLYDFYEHCIGEIINDRQFLRKKYFQRPQSVINSKIVESKLKGQSELMGINRSKSNLAECPVCAVQITHQDVCALSCGNLMHTKCFQECMKQQILSKKFPLKCPFQQCTKAIQTQDVQEYLSKQLVSKYLEFTLHHFVDKNSKNMSWCPTPGCANAFEFDEHTSNYKCPQCKKHYCLKCKTQMHNGLTCQQNQESMNLSQTDKQFMEFVKGSNYKQCPKCKFWVQKSHGCCHMTCRCTYQFCYHCGVEYGQCNCQQDYQDYYGNSDDQDYSDQNDDDGQDDERQQDQEQADFSKMQSQNQKMQIQE